MPREFFAQKIQPRGTSRAASVLHFSAGDRFIFFERLGHAIADDSHRTSVEAKCAMEAGGKARPGVQVYGPQVPRAPGPAATLSGAGKCTSIQAQCALEIGGSCDRNTRHWCYGTVFAPIVAAATIQGSSTAAFHASLANTNKFPCNSLPCRLPIGSVFDTGQIREPCKNGDHRGERHVGGERAGDRRQQRDADHRQ